MAVSEKPPGFIKSRLALFPIGTRLSAPSGETRLTISGCDIQALAEEHGTPLYLYDQATLDASVGEYRQSLSTCYPGEAGITYAGKAFLCVAVAQWAFRMGMWIDCTGAGELAIASAAGVPWESLLVHGVNKSAEDISAAVAGAGTLVIDNLVELGRLIDLFQKQPARFPRLWLRYRPGVAVDTHTYTRTGQEDSKFGLSADELLQGVRRCLQEELPLVGLHFHQGSHFHDPAPLSPALSAVLDIVMATRKELGWVPAVLSPGGGWGVPYHEDDLPHPSVGEYVRFLSVQLTEGCRQRGLPLPRLQPEPGRSLTARAGVAVYQIGAVKNTANRRWLLLDGGLADNPRPALYRARYSALPVLHPDRPASGPAWLAGPFCESGDILIESLPLPELQSGELVAVPVSGAYQISMASNYNGARKPAVLWLCDDQAYLIQRRETLQDLFRRDLPLPK